MSNIRVGGVLDKKVDALSDMIRQVQGSEDQFRTLAHDSMDKAKDSFRAAGKRFEYGVCEDILAGEFAVASVGEAISGLSHVLGGTFWGAAGTVAGIGDLAVDFADRGAYYGAVGMTKAFTGLGDEFQKLGGGKLKSTKTTGAKGSASPYFSDHLFDLAGKKFAKVGPAFQESSHDAAIAGAFALLSLENKLITAWDVGEGLCHTGFAAGCMGVVGAKDCVEWGLRAARAGVILADKGSEKAADACFLAAQLSARMANAMANNQEHKVVVSDDVRQAIAQLEAAAA